MSDQNIRTVQEIYAAFGRGDVPAIVERIAEDMRHFGIASDRPVGPWHMQITKKPDVPKFFQALAESADFTRFEPRDFAASGDHVYCTIGFDAVLKKNGKTLTQDRGVHRFTFKNGKVVEWFGTEDTAKTAGLFAV